ncbi:MAG TPA: REP-associated tyrosine transposase [Candidatus Brocadiia bacterium]|nr:transposase [Candidatus Brocadiales bacterium]
MKYKIEQQRRKTIHHYNIPCHAHFLTFSCYQELLLLSQERTRHWLIEAIIEAKEKYKYALWAYVIMPEHVHLLVYPLVQTYNISSFLKTLKQSVARKAKYYLQENNPSWLDKLSVKHGARKVFRFWQAEPGYDRNINSENELFEKIHYVHNNPVKRGLVSTPQEWKWSSASWYNGEKDVVLAIDDFSFSTDK